MLSIAILASVALPARAQVVLPPGQLLLPIAGTVNQVLTITGVGGITKSGVGFLNLFTSGGNTYSGPTIILQGTVGGLNPYALSPNSSHILGGGTLNLAGFDQAIGSLAGAGTVTMGAGILTTGGDGGSTIYSGLITGTGVLVKTGAGTFTLTGANTYSGGTVIAGGTLAVTNDANLGVSRVLTLVGAGGGIDTSGLAVTLASSIGGPGAFTKVGAGVLTLAGVNTYTGGTTIAGGTLLIGAGVSLPAATALTVNAGAAFDVNNLTLQVGSIAGVGAVNLGSGTLITGNNNTSTTFGGTLTGTGSLVKEGGGTLTLTSATANTGGTTVNAGTLALGAGGSLAATAPLTVNGGAFALGTNSQTVSALAGTRGGLALGTGTLTVNQVLNTTFGGVIAGAGSLVKSGSGMLTLNGINTYTGTTTVTGGTLAVGDTNNPQASIAGPVVVNGGTVQGFGAIGALTNIGGIVAPGGSIGTLTVGQFTQGPGGTLRVDVSPAAASQLRVLGAANLNGTLALLFAPGTYRPARYPIVTATTVTGTFASVTGTVPTLGLAQEIVYLPNEVDLVLGTDARTVAPRNTSVYPGQATAIIDGGHEAIGMLLQRLAASRADSGGARAMLPTDAMFASASTTQLDAAQALIAQMPGVLARYDGWFRAVGSFASVSGTSRSPGFDTNAGGFLAGIDRALGQTARVGIAVGYVRTNLSQADRVSATIDTPRVALYGSERVGPIVIDGALGYAFNHLEASRPVALIGAIARSDRDGHEASAALQARHRLNVGAVGVTPRAGVQYEHLSLESFTERGAAPFDLSAARLDTDSLRPFVGVSVDASIMREALRIMPELRLAYAREVLDVARISQLSTGAGEVFRMTTANPSRDFLTVGAGLGVRSANVEVYADYDVTLPIGNVIRHSVSAGLRYRF